MLDVSWLQNLSDFFSQIMSLGVEELLRRYGYYAILLMTFLEGETIVIIAGIFAAKGMMNPYLIALVAFAGSFTSDQIMFSLGRYKGGAIIKRFPKLGKNVDRSARLLKKYDTFLILGFRFVYGVRNVTPILLGISGVSHWKFFYLNFIGAALWAVSFTAGGYFFGKVFKRMVGQAGHVFVYVIGAAVIGLILWWLFYRKKVHQDQPVPRASGRDIYPHGHEPEQEKKNDMP